jgi:type II secretory pathway pseudopilin PulG
VRILEGAVAAAILAIAAGAALYALSSFGKYVAQQNSPQRKAALLLAQQTLRMAQNAWKYGSPGSAPAGTQTTGFASVSTSLSGGGATAQLSVTVRYTPAPEHDDSGTVTISGELSAKAPRPGTQIDHPGLVPLPSGAP